MDFLHDLDTFKLKNRINFKKEMTYGNLFQETDIITVSELPLDFPNHQLATATLEKLRKANIRMFRVIDVFKNFVDNTNYSSELEPGFREKLMANLFGLFAKYSEHQRTIKQVFKMLAKIKELRANVRMGQVPQAFAP